MVLTYRDVWMLPVRVIAHISLALVCVQFFGSDSGYLSGCVDEFKTANNSYFENYKSVIRDLNENLGVIIYVVMVVWFGSIFCVLLSYPKQMHILLKEYRNGWYSIFSFYLAQVIVDLVFQITIPNLVSIPIYIGTGQYDREEWRLYYFIPINILLALTSSSMGLIVSVFLMNYPTAAVFIGANFGFILILFSGELLI